MAYRKLDPRSISSEQRLHPVKKTFRSTECGRRWAAMLADRHIARPIRVLMLDAEDSRVIEAANKLADMRFVQPVLVQQTDGASSRIKVAHSSSDISLVNAGDLEIGAALLCQNEVDAVIAGAISSSGEVIRTGIKSVGVVAEGVVSSYFLMIVQDNLEAYADCAVIPDPSSEQLAQIAIDTADNFQRITGLRPQIAFLSFSTLGSAEHNKIEKTKRAVELARRIRPDYSIDGELQFDAAYSLDVARKKAPESKVAGNANVYIFPDLAAGNIAYKVAERVGGASAIGPILQGLKKPWLDLSRGCSADDIIDLALIAGAIVHGRERIR